MPMKIFVLFVVSLFAIPSSQSLHAQEVDYTPTQDDIRLINNIEQLLDKSSNEQLMSVLEYLSNIYSSDVLLPKQQWYISDLIVVAQSIAIDRLAQLAAQKTNFDNYSLIYWAYNFGDYSALRIPTIAVWNTAQIAYRIKNSEWIVIYTNQESVARQNGLHDSLRKYAPLEYTILWDGILKWYHKRLIWKKVWETAIFTILPWEAFQIRRWSMIATDILTVEIDILTIK